MIPCKTHNDITIIINRYRKIAQTNDREYFKGHAPIDQWANIIRQNSVYNVLCPFARAFKYIKLFEKHNSNNENVETTDSDSIESEDVNITECYDLLSKLSEGLTPKALNNATQYLIMQLLKDIAKDVNNDKDKYGAVNFLRGLSLASFHKEQPKTYGKRKITDLDEPALNPLRVSMNLYKKRRD